MSIYAESVRSAKMLIFAETFEALWENGWWKNVIPSELTHSIPAEVYPSMKYGLSFPTVSLVVSQPPEPEIGDMVQLTPALFVQVKVLVAEL